MLIQLRHHVYIKFDLVSLGPSILFPWPFWPIWPFGTSPVLKSTANRSFHLGHIYFIRSAIFGYSIFLTIAFLDLFLYPSRGILAFHCSCPFSHMLRNTVYHFLFSMSAYITFSNTSSTWAFSFSQQHLKWPGGVLHSAKHWDNRPEWFRHTIQLTKGKFCHQLRAETQYKQGGLSNKGSSLSSQPLICKRSGWKMCCI